MAKKMLNNPSSTVVTIGAEKLQLELEQVRAELIAERSKKTSPIKEVIKTEIKTEFVDNPALLEKYNHAMKENGELKMRLNRIAKPAPLKEIRVETVEKVVDKIIYDKRLIAAAFIIGMVLGCFTRFVR